MYVSFLTIRYGESNIKENKEGAIDVASPIVERRIETL
jgi:hypothetical protein